MSEQIPCPLGCGATIDNQYVGQHIAEDCSEARADRADRDPEQTTLVTDGGQCVDDTDRTYWDVKVYEDSDERETIRNLTHAQKHALMQAFDREGVTATAMEYRSEDGSFQGSETVNGRYDDTATDQQEGAE